MHKLRRFLPSPEAVRQSRWLRWMGPRLQHPRLWHLSRRGVALGLAMGVFFGLLIPLAQIPLSVGAAVLLRANVPAAVASTLVSNPLTFGPLYYLGWRIGTGILGQSADPTVTAEEFATPTTSTSTAGVAGFFNRVMGVGKPLFLGLSILATGVGLATYVVVWWLWAFVVLWRRRRRHSGRLT